MVQEVRHEHCEKRAAGCHYAVHEAQISLEVVAENGQRRSVGERRSDAVHQAVSDVQNFHLKRKILKLIVLRAAKTTNDELKFKKKKKVYATTTNLE